jgi:hypothetical protein
MLVTPVTPVARRDTGRPVRQRTLPADPGLTCVTGGRRAAQAVLPAEPPNCPNAVRVLLALA